MNYILVTLCLVGAHVFAETQAVTTEQPPSASSSTVSARHALAWKGLAKEKEYTEAASASLAKQPGLLTLKRRPLKEIQNICPRFADLNDKEKSEFWIQFASQVALGESALKPENTLKVGGARATGSQGFSGLYGSYFSEFKERKHAHDSCVFATAEEARDLQKGSDCFFKLLNEKIQKAGCIFCKDSRSFHLGYLSFKEARKRMRMALAESELCRSLTP